MADTVPDHFTTEFHTNWLHAIQQGQSRTGDYVRWENWGGERKRYSMLDGQTDTEIAARKTPTNVVDATDHFRWCTHKRYEIANRLDEWDQGQLAPLILPTGDYTLSHAKAYNRRKDIVALDAALGSALTGSDGTTASPLPASQKIADGGVGLTIDKLIQAKQILDEADADDEGDRIIVVRAHQISDLLNTTEVTSADYNTVRALVAGQVNTFMGFTFRRTELVPAPTATTCVAWTRGAIRGIMGGMRNDIDRLPENSHAIQTRSRWQMGAVRIYDEAVVQIDCIEA